MDEKEQEFISKEDLLRRWKIDENRLREIAFQGTVLVGYNKDRRAVWSMFPYHMVNRFKNRQRAPRPMFAHLSRNESHNQATFDIVWPSIAFFKISDVLFFEKRHNMIIDEESMNQTEISPQKLIAIAKAEEIKRDNPNLPLPEVTRIIKQYLSDKNITTYSDKHLQRIIKHLGFPPGSPGRPRQKNIQTS